MRKVKPGWSLPQEFYTEADFFALDMERIFRRFWLYAGHESNIPVPGDYFTWQIGDDSLIIIRRSDGEVSALFNTCRHRGSVICTEQTGRAKKLVCPYHQWVYDTDGTLLNARLMSEDFDKTGFGLRRAQVRTLEGLIFVCLSDDPPAFEPFSREVSARLALHELRHVRICHSREYLVRANWKLVEENSRECYHCGAGHPQYARAVGFAAAIGSKPLTEEDQKREAERHSRLAALGLDPRPLPFLEDSWYHCRRFYLRGGFLTESLDGQPVAPVMGRLPGYEAGVLAMVTLPNLLLEASPDYLVTLRVTPSGPRTTTVRVEWLVREDAVEGVDFNVERLTAFWRMTGEQDWNLCENNQLGVNSSVYRPGPYGPDERGVKHFVKWYLKHLSSANSLTGALLAQGTR